MFTMIAAVVAAGLGMPGHADAADGYTLTSTREYRFDPAGPNVTVESTYVMTNTSPDSDLGDGRTQTYFYDSVRVPLEQGAAGVTVNVDGQPARYEQIDDLDGFKWLDVGFDSNLRYGDSATIVVRYELKGAGGSVLRRRAVVRHCRAVHVRRRRQARPRNGASTRGRADLGRCSCR